MSRRPLRPISAGAITLWAVVGLVAGWVLHPIAERVNGTAPVVTWLQPGVLFLVAAIMLATAWTTWRQVQVAKVRIEAHHAVNRLVLGRACALVGALLAGGYAGYALSWLDYGDDPLAGQRIERAVVAAVCGALICLGGILLERACRISDDEDDPTGAGPSAAGPA